MAIGKVNTGGGGAGGTLVVTGIAGDTITATKDGKTYSRTFNSAGKAIFRGLATGTWALTMTNGSQTVTRNVTITADYSLTMAYFTATITVTYPATSTCTCSDGTTTLTDTNTGTSEKTVTFTIPNTGAWTLSCTDGTKTASKTVTISTEGEAVSVELAYDLLLFFNGDSYTDVTGGWVSATVTGTASCSVNGAYLVMSAAAGGHATGTTANLIDLTNFSVLEVTIAETGKVTDNRSYVCVLGPTGQTLAQKNALTQGVHTVDLSEITGDCRIRLGVHSALTYKVSKVRLY